jgi:hypothetical protein
MYFSHSITLAGKIATNWENISVMQGALAKFPGHAMKKKA